MIATTGSNKNAQFYAYEGSVPAQLVIDYTPPQPNLTQAHYRWRNDDGPEQSVSVAVDTVQFYPGQQWKQHKFDAERCHRDQPLSFGGDFLRLKCG